ncbi:MAG: endonuclease/exonuclease/phosphatase family protein, partial [Bacillota bacterium]
GLLLAFLTITEYRPDDIETVSVDNNQSTSSVRKSERISLMTFNIGYAGLGREEDIVLDGGDKSRPDSKDIVEDYFSGITSIIDSHYADIYLFQEVDVQSRRSYYINQVESLKNHLGEQYGYNFAYNFNAVFVPFPVSFTEYLGPVESGLQTFSRFNINESERQQFPGSFSWPMRVANLKRAMVVNRMPVEDSDKEFVVVNIHMSAYDADGTLRNKEMTFLKAFLEDEASKGNYVVIGGDFNQTFPGAVGAFPAIQDEEYGAYYVAHAIEDDYLPDNYQFVFDATNPTGRSLYSSYTDEYLSGTQYYVIDGFIVSNNIDINLIETLDYDFLYSDHNPVRLEITLIDES